MIDVGQINKQNIQLFLLFTIHRLKIFTRMFILIIKYALNVKNNLKNSK